MAKVARKTYISYELDWLEKKTKELMDVLDACPFHALEDRTETFITTKGIPTIKIVATKEDQLKALVSILKDLPAMFAALDELRENRAMANIEIRGSAQMGGMMKKHLEDIGGE